MPVPVPSVRAGDGEPLLLVHPFMTSHDVWTDVIPHLAGDFEVVAATLPGHWGGPHLPRREVSLAAFADGIEELLDELGWDTCHVAGNSIGGWLSLELARRGRARSVTAIAPAGGWRKFSAAQLLVGSKFLGLAPLALIGHATGDLGCRVGPLRRGVLRVVSADPRAVSRERANAFIRAASNCSAFLPYIWSDLRRGGDLHLDEVAAPVRLVFCEDDVLLPPRRYAAPFVTGLEQAEVVSLSGVGHIPMFDDPQGIAALIAEHARRNSAPARHADTA